MAGVELYVRHYFVYGLVDQTPLVYGLVDQTPLVWSSRPNFLSMV